MPGGIQWKTRGLYLVSFSPEAGWTFSSYYSMEEENPDQTVGYRRYTPAEADAIPASGLKPHPFFMGFRDEGIYGEGGSAYLQANDMVRWHALSHGIPAESFAAGANPVPQWGEKAQGNILKDNKFKNGLIRNVDMSVNCGPDGRESVVLPWIHSYFIENSLFDTAVLYEALVEHIGTTKKRKGSK